MTNGVAALGEKVRQDDSLKMMADSVDASLLEAVGIPHGMPKNVMNY